MGRKFHHLTYSDRLKIEALHMAKHTSQEIGSIRCTCIYDQQGIKAWNIYTSKYKIGRRKNVIVRNRQKKSIRLFERKRAGEKISER